MDVRIHSVKANNHAGNIWVYVMTSQKGQSRMILSSGSQNFTQFTGKFSWRPRV